jgi:hypothetical protein
MEEARLQAGHEVALVHTPGHYAGLFKDAPKDIGFTAAAKASDAIHLFISDAKRRKEIETLSRHLPPAIMLWVSWPKLSSPLSKGLREDDICETALATGLVDIKVCAVDQDWSGLKLTRRKT